MSARNFSSASYRSDYELLQLDDHADWEVARANYRRLVHIWHPDKYSQRPNEKTHAQNQFITITTAYNSLRAFKREHGHLPFEFDTYDQTENVADPRPPFDAKHTTRKKGKSTSDDIFSSGVLGSRIGRKQSELKLRTRHYPVWWIASGLMIMVATITFLLVQDHKANRIRIEEGREIVKQAPESEFTQNAKEIRKNKAREAFLKPPE